MKAYAYLRVSDKSQLTGDGFTRQALAISTYAQFNGFEIAGTFEERGVTGEATAEDRPAWTEMLLEAKQSGVSCILIEKLDRLARELMVQETLLLSLRKDSITIVSTCEPDLCATDPTRVVIRQILGAFAQYDKAQLVLKLQGARLRKRTDPNRISRSGAELPYGKCAGKKPFGDHPGEAETVTFMREWYSKAGSYRQVALELNARGIVGRHGGRWTPQLVSRVLTGIRPKRSS